MLTSLSVSLSPPLPFTPPHLFSLSDTGAAQYPGKPFHKSFYSPRYTFTPCCNFPASSCFDRITFFSAFCVFVLLLSCFLSRFQLKYFCLSHFYLLHSTHTFLPNLICRHRRRLVCLWIFTNVQSSCIINPRAVRQN